MSTSMTSTYSAASTKDYSTVLGELTSSYGFGGSPIIVSPTKTSAKPKKSSRAPSSTSSASSSSSSSMSTAPSKDYSKAMADLQSSYGFGGSPAIPSLAPSTSSSTASRSSPKPSSKSSALFKIPSRLSSIASFSTSSSSYSSSYEPLVESKKAKSASYVTDGNHPLYPAMPPHFCPLAHLDEEFMGRLVAKPV